ncbi:MAG TPA: hypothetical protein VHC95_06655 [Opitutales bacterium]|nr:hypothetical protein [Opitutales bacterium]
MKAQFFPAGVFLAASLVATAASMAATATPADNADRPIAFAKTPAAVQATLKATAGKDPVNNIIRHVDDEGVIFAAEITKPDGSSRDLLVTNNGTLLSLEMTLAEITGPAQAAIKTQAGKNTITTIDKTFDDDQIAYAVTLATPAGEKNFTISDEGQLQRLDVLPGETPAIINAAIKKQAGSEKITLVEKVFTPPDISYDVTLTKLDGDTKTFTLNSNGELSCVEVTLDQTPKAVRETIVGVLGRNKLLSINEDLDESGVTYDVVMAGAAGKTRDFSVDATGKLLSEQVFIDQIPAEARKTILEQIGGGKILQIDKSYEPDSGVLPFVVHGRKGGKEFNFSVGPKGRFLGMDE